jgi:Uma2 family endonuclease
MHVDTSGERGTRMGLPKPIMTEGEYLAFDRGAEERHIYVDGEVFAMAGESGEHADIVTNIVVSLANQLRDGPCRVRSGNSRVRSGPLPKSLRRRAGLYSYPDVFVICDEPQYLDEHRDVVLNPKVIVEILSESTEAFDRGGKFTRYQEYNPTLSDYVLVSQDQPQIEHYHREKDGTWKYQRHRGLKAMIKLTSVKCVLKSKEVYRRVAFKDIDGNTTS